MLIVFKSLLPYSCLQAVLDYDLRQVKSYVGFIRPSAGGKHTRVEVVRGAGTCYRTNLPLTELHTVPTSLHPSLASSTRVCVPRLLYLLYFGPLAATRECKLFTGAEMRFTNTTGSGLMECMSFYGVGFFVPTVRGEKTNAAKRKTD